MSSSRSGTVGSGSSVAVGGAVALSVLLHAGLLFWNLPPTLSELPAVPATPQWQAFELQYAPPARVRPPDGINEQTVVSAQQSSWAVSADIVVPESPASEQSDSQATEAESGLHVEAIESMRPRTYPPPEPLPSEPDPEPEPLRVPPIYVATASESEPLPTPISPIPEPPKTSEANEPGEVTDPESEGDEGELEAPRPTGGTGQTEDPARGIDVEVALRTDWRNRVEQAINQALREQPPEYPRLAQRLGQEGQVEVAFEVTSNGTVQGARVVNGSGHERLDEAAVSRIQQLADLPRGEAVESLAHQLTPLDFEMPIEFRLQ